MGTHTKRMEGLRRSGGRGGFSTPELTVVIGVVGMLFSMTVPYFVSYYGSAAITAGSQQVVAQLNQARGLAIKQNDNVCVQLASTTQMVFRLGSCAGAVWIGAGTDGVGNINLPEGFALAGNDITFSYLGAALPATTYTLTHGTTSSTATVSIAMTGRITSP